MPPSRIGAAPSGLAQKGHMWREPTDCVSDEARRRINSSSL